MKETIARSIICEASTASLGTLGENGMPFVSLVTVAATSPTTIVMLLSGLAKHTKNLRRSPVCSLLLVQAGGESGDPLQGVRLTVEGEVLQLGATDSEAARSAFLDKHPSAAMYVDFGDFAFFDFKVAQAHLVAGFGRIETLTADQLQ